MDHLPPEIVNLVHRHLDPLSSLHLALVSRQLASHSHDALSLNKRRFELYRTVSDRDRKATDTVVKDSAVGWHVEYLELWNEGAIASNDDQSDVSRGAASLAMDETSPIDRDELYTRIWSITGLDVPLDLSDDSKCQDALQTLLLLSCPRVRMLRGLRPRRSNVDEGRDVNSGTDPVTLCHASIVCNITEAIHKLPQPIWPQSLSCLRQLAIGLPSQNDRGRAILRSACVLPLLLLPNLETVYIRGLIVTDREQEVFLTKYGGRDGFNVIPTASSSIRHVCLEACVGADAKHAICNIIRACRSLETLMLSSCETSSGFDWIVSELRKHHHDSLRRFFPCGDVSQLRGYRGAMYEDMYSSFRSLEVVPMDPDEISGEIERILDRRQHFGQEACLLAFENLKSDMGDLETLVLHGREDMDDAHLLDEGLASLVSPEDGSARKLKRIFIDKIIDVLLRRQKIERRAVAFPKTREAAERFGVCVHCEQGALDAFGDGICRRIFGVGLTLDQLR